MAKVGFLFLNAANLLKRKIVSSILFIRNSLLFFSYFFSEDWILAGGQLS